MAHLQDGFDNESFEAGRISATSTGLDGDTPQPNPEPVAEQPKRSALLRLVRPIAAPATNVRSRCPDCLGELAVLRVIPGRARSEYWTLRCTYCGGVHLDILQAAPVSAGSHADGGADETPEA